MSHERPPVVLLHGLAGSRRWWSRNVDALGADRRVLPVDLPGFGWRRGRFDLEGAADAVAERLRAEAVDRGDVIGHSLGGLVAARLAARHPELVRRLVLVAPAGGSPRTLARSLLPAAATARSTSPQVLMLAAAGAARAGPVSLLAAARALLREHAAGDPTAVRSPTLVVWGERDRLLPPRRFADAYVGGVPDARLVVLPGRTRSDARASGGVQHGGARVPGRGLAARQDRYRGAMQFGYALSSEEHAPRDLVRNARLAEEAGFGFALISDHFHPWVDAQGHSPFVWSVIGGIAQATERLRLGTGVTCPTIRIHPAIIAQAAATCGAMMPGRFFLGVGTGENLNEHILGDKWPAPDERLEMLEEAIDVIRLLWEGGYQTYRGDYYTVEQARLYTLPDEPVPIAVAAAKPLAADVAARSGDALISTAPDADLVQGYRDAGGSGPTYAQVTCCWAPGEEEAVRTVHEVWPNAGLKGDLSQELPLPLHFEQASQLVTPDELAESLPVGPNAERFVEQVRQYADAGFDHIYFHQIGGDQEGFFRFFRDELAPLLDRARVTAA